MNAKEELEQFLKSLTSKKEVIAKQLMDDINVSTVNNNAFSNIIDSLNTGKKINDDKFKKAIAVAVRKQCEIQTRILHLMLIFISTDDFNTQVTQLRMKLDPSKGQEILQEMLRDKMNGK